MTVARAEGPDVLEERARALARPLDDGTSAATRELLVASIGDTNVALDLGRVRDVLAPDHLARLPGGRPLGFALRNIRGELLVVVDLGALLGLVPALPVEQRWVVVVDGRDAPLGLLVDRADALVAVVATAVGPLPAHDEQSRADLLLGVTGDGLCVVDTDAVLASTSLLARADHTAHAADDQEGSL